MKLVPTNPTQPVNDLLNGGRTRIRTRVAGLEGQSDIRLHYTSKSGQKHLFHELWVWIIIVALHIYGI